MWAKVTLVVLAGTSVFAQMDRSATEYPIEASNEPPIVESKLFKVVKSADGVKKELSPASLVVGIMSSPSHFSEREALRSSWIQFQSLTDPKLNSLSVEEKQSMVIRFVIGDTRSSSTEAAIQRESFVNHDIIRVPVAESYFNLTLKTGEFFKWADSTYAYKWIMKCDDDSFVRVDLILQDLLKRNTPMLYMGKIWTGTPVDRRIDSHTPWKQHHPFAAGAGYILSADLVSFIIRNYDALYKFPLEDVAVGSWISALKVNYVDNPHFHSLPEGCDKDMLLQNPADIRVMKETFFNSVKGIPCHAKPDPFDAKTKNVTDHVLLELGIPKPAERDNMQMVGAQSLVAMDADEHAIADDDVDGMTANAMNANMPSSTVMSKMNGDSGVADGVELAQASQAAVDRMNASVEGA
jgi:galactosylxylosylprotein 3-beta-galactosyltransferase